jgi:hypothetical protein
VFAITGAYVAGVVSTTGNITGNYFVGNGSQLTGIVSSYGNANVVANLAALGSNPVSTTGNITAGNIIAGNLDAVNLVINSISSDDSTFVTIEDGLNVVGAIAILGNITGSNLVINRISSDDSTFVTVEDGLNVVGEVAVLGNITGSNLVINNISSDDSTFVTVEDGLNVVGDIDLSGNITGGNVSTAGVVKTGSFVTGTIPTAAGVGAGARAFVTDATSVTFGNLYVGGAANAMPVWSDGAAWYVG